MCYKELKKSVSRMKKSLKLLNTAERLDKMEMGKCGFW